MSNSDVYNNEDKNILRKSTLNDKINYKAPSMTNEYKSVNNYRIPIQNTPSFNRPYLQSIPYNRPNRIYVANNSTYPMPSRSNTMASYQHDYYDLDMDIVNIKRLYPSTVRSLEPFINEECDKLDYEGSFMFDENPDKVSVERIVDRIYERTNPLDDEPELEASYMIGRRRRRDNRRDIITIILLNEFLNRRRRRRNRRPYY
ncbi:MAG TPA: hypothetical protein GXZ21_10020 [Clostridiales bacterium]|nr:hypothetical protein [Clostridiales bacterium]